MSALRRSAVYRLLGRLYQQGLMVAIAEAASPESKIEDIVAYERANTRTLEGGDRQTQDARGAVVEDIRRMADLCRERGVAYLVVIFPNRYQIEEVSYTRARFNEMLARDLEDRGIPVIDLFPLFKQAASRDPLYLADTHPNAAGQEIAAAAVARWVTKHRAQKAASS